LEGDNRVRRRQRSRLRSGARTPNACGQVHPTASRRLLQRLNRNTISPAPNSEVPCPAHFGTHPPNPKTCARQVHPTASSRRFRHRRIKKTISILEPPVPSTVRFGEPALLTRPARTAEAQSSPQQLLQSILVNHLRSEFLRLVQLRTRVLTRKNIVRLLAHGAGNPPTRRLDPRFGIFAR